MPRSLILDLLIGLLCMKQEWDPNEKPNESGTLKCIGENLQAWPWSIELKRLKRSMEMVAFPEMFFLLPSLLPVSRPWSSAGGQAKLLSSFGHLL